MQNSWHDGMKTSILTKTCKEILIYETLTFINIFEEARLVLIFLSFRIYSSYLISFFLTQRRFMFNFYLSSLVMYIASKLNG